MAIYDAVPGCNSRASLDSDASDWRVPIHLMGNDSPRNIKPLPINLVRAKTAVAPMQFNFRCTSQQKTEDEYDINCSLFPAVWVPLLTIIWSDRKEDQIQMFGRMPSRRSLTTADKDDSESGDCSKHVCILQMIICKRGFAQDH